ncbi:heterokaryon incompatibility protein-domain-containing protein [Lophiotrema nucula]|uniref:Heterokaryon incompatibility protein-domain-containing protein n=1 Tax=Lophiotrema nucula TaxID=690887 RepID=A0A6A5Z935_9PLEO|nr:heterokaryon incompatibility protein-domain-containing protein [Lophiotrema nucula]
MQIIETDFEEAVKPDPYCYHVDYVALSYTWGTASMDHGHSRGTTPAHSRTNSSLNGWARDPLYTQSGTGSGRQPTKLTSNNLSYMLHEGALDSQTVYIPATIRDAIDVTRRAGQRYLWVDSLCIIQEERHPDNEANIARMSRIYGEALFTIVAAASLQFYYGRRLLLWKCAFGSFCRRFLLAPGLAYIALNFMEFVKKLQRILSKIYNALI